MREVGLQYQRSFQSLFLVLILLFVIYYLNSAHLEAVDETRYLKSHARKPFYLQQNHSKFRSDRKAFVFSMINNTHDPGRYERFTTSWTKAYPELEIEKIMTVKSLRGVSLIYSSFHAIQLAMRENLDYLIILEDDALPFVQRTSWEARFNQTLDSWPKKSPLLFLGCHHINSTTIKQALAEKRSSTSLQFAFGTYAYVIRKRYFGLMSKYFQAEAERIDGTQPIKPDVDWWENIFRHPYTPAYVAMPLLVDHAPGFSASWGKPRRDNWSGLPNWWNIKYKGRLSSDMTVLSHQGLAEELKKFEQ